MDILIPTGKNKFRRKAIKLTAEYYCMGCKIRQHNKVEVGHLWINTITGSIKVSKEEILETVKVYRKTLEK